MATVTDNRKGHTRKSLEPGQSQLGGVANDPRQLQAKTMKNIDRRLNYLSAKVDRSLREIQGMIGGGSAGAKDKAEGK